MASSASNPPEAPALSPASVIIGAFKRKILSLQEYSYLLAESIRKCFSSPHYPADLLQQMDLIGVGSLPIIILTGFFIGGVMVLNTASQFQRFGTTAFTANAVAIALVRELGPVISALLVTGRNGSAIASELGSMVVTEQVDAMRALGTDPVRKLVVPRLLAMIIVLPLLTAISDLVGMTGGFSVAHYTLGLSGAEFWNRAIAALAIGDLVQGFVKPLVFAVVIATVGCYYGLRTYGGTQGVGRSTISAVVAASVAVIVLDFFLGKLLLFVFPFSVQ